MWKIGTIYVLTEQEMDAIKRDLDRLYTYKVLAEIREIIEREEDISEDL